MTNAALIELWQRVIKLEGKVEELEVALAGSSEVRMELEGSADSEEGFQSEDHGESRDTRERALVALKGRLDERDPDVEVLGRYNRGKNPLRALLPDGAERRILLSASRDHAGGERFSSWNAIAPSSVESGEYDTYVLSVEDSQGRLEFFVLTPEEMERELSRKTPSGGFYHFYIAQDTDDPTRFVEVRDGGRSSFDQYHDAWASLVQ